jgi:hypothetical protein
MIDSTAPRFGLPASLWIPIAAANVAAIETYVGRVVQSVTDPADGRLNALLNNKIIYADPMDLTKMLDIPPGTEVLNGVRDTQQLFYP